VAEKHELYDFWMPSDSFVCCMLAGIDTAFIRGNMTKKTPLVKALELAIKDMKWVCHEKYTAQVHAANYGFIFGIKAKINYDEHQEAIRILEGLLQK
jgi:hypothetical protein